MKRLIDAALVLALVVVSLGAYVRLSDAGLGCPDWPGCYGHVVGVPDPVADQATVAAAFPGQPLVVAKAWKEVVHRYAAATLGLLVLAIAARAWARRYQPALQPALQPAPQPVLLPTLLLGLVVVQALLGMWTVTLQLEPAVVTAHLLGGMATLGLLLQLRLRLGAPAATAPPGGAPRCLPGDLALAALALQIGLGGWVSSHYAALACPDFPACRGGQWLPLDTAAAIHMAHRTGALLVALAAGAFAMALVRRRQVRPALLVAAALGLQLGLGVANVLGQLPLPLAVAHNTGAALLLGSVLYARARWRPPSAVPLDRRGAGRAQPAAARSRTA
jgi:cytochrome c oxidase assembly protein subunit 15